MRYGLLTIVLLAALPCLADGVPIDETGFVTVDHLALMLSPSQIAEVGRSRILTLDADQFESMRKLIPGFPERFRVITPSYHDCSCGLGAYGIWTRREHVAVPYPWIDIPPEELGLNPLPGRQEPPIKGWSHVLFDIDGEMYFAEERIPEADVLLALDDIARGDEDRRVLWLSLPPRSSADVDSAIRRLVDRLTAEGERRGVKVMISG